MLDNYDFSVFALQESIFYGFARDSKRNKRAYQVLTQLTFQLGVYVIEENGEYFVRKVGDSSRNVRITINNFEDFFKVMRWGFIFNIRNGVGQELYEQASYAIADFVSITLDKVSVYDPTIIEYQGIVLNAFDTWGEVYDFLAEVENEQQARLLAYGLVRVIREHKGTVSGQAKSLLNSVDRRALRIDNDGFVVIRNGECFDLTQTWTIGNAIELIKALRN